MIASCSDDSPSGRVVLDLHITSIQYGDGVQQSTVFAGLIIIMHTSKHYYFLVPSVCSVTSSRFELTLELGSSPPHGRTVEYADILGNC